MNITIKMSDVVYDIQNISHLESATIDDVEKRYLIEAGTEKLDEIYRCIEDAESLVRLVISRFLSAFNRTPAEGTAEQYVYTFTPSLRNQQFREDVVGDSLKSAIVQLSLGSFYDSVAQGELSKTHKDSATAALVKLERLYFEKTPPKRPKLW